jgi:hypothetical protein
LTIDSVSVIDTVAVPGPTASRLISSPRLARSPAHIASALRRAMSSGVTASG